MSVLRLILFACLAAICSGKNILEIMEGKSINQFNQLLVNHPYASQFVQIELTLFVPTDKAMNSYVGEKDEQFLLNHMVNINFRIDDDLDSVKLGSLLPSSPPLYVSRDGRNSYVNGASVLMRNLAAVSDRGGRKQKLHIIDRVLEPLTPSVRNMSAAYIGLTAGKLLRQWEDYDLKGHAVGNFSTQVKNKKMFDLFDKPGRHTFFIPVDAGFAELDKVLVDEDVIPGHVIPDELVFTKPLSKTEQKTATYPQKSKIRVTAAIQESENKAYHGVVRSNTVQGDRNRAREQVLANIVYADVPVSNGVVHLIDRPLVIVAKRLWRYLKQEEADAGRLSKFARYVQEYGGQGLKDLISQSAEGTILAPTNQAFESLMPEPELRELLADPQVGPRILGLHYVDQRIPYDDVRIVSKQEEKKMFGTKSVYPEGENSWLWYYMNEDNRTLMVDGLGVAAEVIEADIGARNGLIHVIDKVLGLQPRDGEGQTIFEKLETDPMLASTFSLGQQGSFNSRLKEDGRNFTFFAPSNAAWDKVRHSFASAHKVLFMGPFAYQSEQILECHLRIKDSMTTDQLVEMTENEGGVFMMRGAEEFRFKKVEDENGEYTVLESDTAQARLIRPNMECSNGVVHVIDNVIMKREDVTLGSMDYYAASAASAAAPAAALLAALLPMPLQLLLTRRT